MMTKIKVTPDCGNSPKREFLKSFNVAFPKGNIDFVLEHVSEDIHWEMIGHKIIKGKDNMLKELTVGNENPMKEFELSSIITHGKEGAANGIFKLSNGKTYKFCDVYRFQGTKNRIVEILSYVIEVSE